MSKAILAAFTALMLTASGCIPAFPRGKVPLPNRNVPASYGDSTDTTNSAQLKWGEFFTDPKLNALIDTALKHNQELNIVSIEIDIAQSEVLSRRGEFLPKLDFETGAGIDKVGSYTSQGKSDDAHHVAKNLPDFAFGFAFSWEIDIWSKLRNATKASVLRYMSSKEGRKFAVTTLVGELADTYYELMAFDAQLEVLKQNIAIQQNALEVVKLQKEAARVTQLAVQRFEAEVLKNQSRQFGIEQHIIEAENHINFLCGRFPQHVDRDSQNFSSIVPAVIQAGIPSQLLENRPDVKQAELALAAAALDVKVARAGFYPSLSINADIGYQAFDFLKLVNTPASLAYSLAAGIIVPLFNRKGLTAKYFTAGSRQFQAVTRYERALLSGYTDVINQLAMIKNLGKSYDLQSQQVNKLIQSIDISAQLFASARANYMEVLLTRRDALESQMELIETKKMQMTAAVGLYQALGGGWR